MIRKRSNTGQALTEYILVLIFVTIIALGLLGKLNKSFDTAFGRLGQQLTEHLSSGVCPTACFARSDQSYKNGMQ